MLAFFSALLTILGPLVATGLTAWIDGRRRESAHDTMDETDRLLVEKAQHPGGPSLLELSRQLERLQREAARKVGHSR